MTAVDLDALVAARAAATPGPWENPYPFTKLIDAPGSTDNLAIVQCDNAADAALIVAAVNALPALIAAARERDALRDAVKGLAEEWEAESSADRVSGEDFDRGAAWGREDSADRLRAAVASTLAEEDDPQ